MLDAKSKSGWEFTDIAILDQKRAQIVNAVAAEIGAALIKKSRALFWDASHEKRVACTVSKRYVKRASTPYWYAYHPAWDDFLGDGSESYFVLGCMDLSFAFAFPLSVMRKHLDALNTTTTEHGIYWHVHLVELQNGEYAMLLPKRSQQLPLKEYRVSLQS